MIGAFVIGAVGLIVLAVVVLGTGHLFSARHTYVLFFKQNINGLRVGAPVKFNGVPIGEVNRILLNLELPHNDVEFQIPAQVRIPVLLTIDEHLLVSHGGRLDLNDPNFLKRAIADGLRAQLGLESLLTGLLYVDLGMHPNAPLNLVLPPGSRYQEIPTIPNALQQVQQSAVHFFSHLDKVDFVKLVSSANTTLDSINQILQTQQVRDTFNHLDQAAERLGGTAVSIQRMVDNVDSSLGPLSKNLQANSVSANRTLDEATATLHEIKIMIEPNSPIVFQTDETLKALSKAAKSINRLADYLEEQPSALIRGRDYKDTGK
jgi:paraquat-inducible protein B